MLYHILTELRDQYSWLNIFRYQTFRAMLAFLVSFFIVLICQPFFIRFMQKNHIKGQPIRDDGPKNHEGKKGTPTMGGLVLVMAVLFSSLLLNDLTNKYIWMTLFVITAFGALGFIDDWKKITKQDSRGLSERQKIVIQFVIATVATVSLLLLTRFSTDLSIPYTKDISIKFGSVFFVIFSSIVIVGSSNAVNLTDGLDGLAIGPVMTVAATYALFAYLGGHSELSKYLGVYHVPGVGELSVILSSILAAGLGFLWYNTFPAQIFMGDLGALALGGGLGFVAVLVKHELVLVIAGGVFVVEAVSVLIQRYFYKLTKRRVFKMAPVHHHFELLGWAEPKIIVRFWIISIVLAIISLTTLKVR